MSPISPSLAYAFLKDWLWGLIICVYCGQTVTRYTHRAEEGYQFSKFSSDKNEMRLYDIMNCALVKPLFFLFNSSCIVSYMKSKLWKFYLALVDFFLCHYDFKRELSEFSMKEASSKQWASRSSSSTFSDTVYFTFVLLSRILIIHVHEYIHKIWIPEKILINWNLFLLKISKSYLLKVYLYWKKRFC